MSTKSLQHDRNSDRNGDPNPDPIDVLIPPAKSPLRRGLIGLLVLAATIAIGLVWAAGAIVPSPFARTSFDGTQGPQINTATGTITVGRYFVNHNSRDVELEQVDVAIPGATVTNVWVEATSPEGDGPPEQLPAIIESGSEAYLMVEIELGDCANVDLEARNGSSEAPWGEAKMTFRFPNNLPPLARTESLGVGSLADQAQACFLVGG